MKTSVIVNAVRDALAPTSVADARLLGHVGATADSCIRARIYSDWARGAMYEECVNSFRTHWDDAPDGGNGWGWQNEYWGKTMLCVAGAIAYTGDKALAQRALEKAHAFVREFQKPNGYLSTYAGEDFLRSNPDSEDARAQACFNVWGRKYTLWALVELHKATGDSECLTAAVKMADHLIAQLSRLGLTLAKTGAWHGISSMSILRPMLELHRLTGTDRYLALADEIVRDLSSESGGPEAILRDARREDKIAEWYPIPTFWAKAYETMSCLEGLADYYRLTGRKDILDGIVAYHGHLVREELNPMCGVGHFDHFVNAAARVNGMTELCDVTHWIRLNRELLLLTGETRYADLIEEAFLNAFLAGVFRGGRWGAHIVRSHGTRHLPAPAQTGMVHHQCCPDNMMRTFFDYSASQVARASDGALSVLLYTDGAATSGADRVEISGGYPWSDGPIVVKATLAADGKVRFRVPHWSATVQIDGQTITPRDGWVEMAGRAGVNSWSLRFDMSPRLANWNARAHDEVPDYTVTYMEWCTPDMVGLARVEPALLAFRGPLVLAKGRLAGTSRDETLFAMTRRAQDWRATLRQAPRTAANAGVVQPWTLTFERAGDTYDIPVADFASVSNVDDPANWFSLWF
ncbi:MAG: glycoside hydrolase family 127 protein [Kiritimatiellae bacterium]|nr:glycoside hydrolase family 127 protein [Kiritimatiellia bacterium]